MLLRFVKSWFQPDYSDVVYPSESTHPPSELPDLVSGNLGVLPENKELLSEVFVCFKQAEQHIKTVELESAGDDLYIPSINELRYVGHHLAKAFAAECAEKEKEELKKAYRHCKRASFDAVELGVVGQLEKIKSFQDDYKKADICAVWSDYLNDISEVAKTQQFVGSQSIHRSREDYFCLCQEHYTKVSSISAKSEASRALLNIKASKERLYFWGALTGWFIAAVLGFGQTDYYPELKKFLRGDVEQASKLKDESHKIEMAIEKEKV